MKPSHIALMVFLAAIWGFNFVPIRIVLDHLPPVSFTALRFLVTVVPAIFLVKRPNLPLWHLMGYGWLAFAGQFLFIFTAIHLGLSAGLASLVIQIQVFFTIGFAALFLKERPKLFQILGALAALGGIAVVVGHTDGSANLLALAIAMLAAASWSGGNIVTKSFGRADMFAVVIWGNFFALLPLAVLAMLIDGPSTFIHSVTQIKPMTALSLAYIVYASTFVGYTLWNKMLACYPAAMVAPFILLVPAFGMLSSSLVLGEAYPLWKFFATLLIIGGLGLNQFGGKIYDWAKLKLSSPHA